jgi:ABC-type antimicrobial peptide transport system permease subunit
MKWAAGSGFRLIVLGLFIGIIVARFVSSALEGVLFGVATTDAVTMLVVTVMLAVIGMAATLVPSWWAARIDPVAVLRRG